MPPTKNQLAKIHIAKKALKLSDETYRDILHINFGKSSAAKLTIQEANMLLDLFRQKGWKSSPPRKKQAVPRRSDTYIDWQGPAEQQQRKVLALWNQLGYDMDKLHARCKKQFKVDRFEWITDHHQLHVLITDLEARVERQRFRR